MAEINFIIYGIIGLFFVLLAAKNVIENIRKNKGKNLKGNFCVICISIILTWLGLLVLYWYGLFDNILAISLLMGMSLTGIYYFIDKKIGKKNKKLKIFRLPFILTLIIIAYYVINFKGFENIIKSALIFIILWALFVLIYFYNNTKFIKKLIECCKG
ncbi:hypothetical protein J4466_04515 [Candidatus Pacearchaeota archaeon]|nr:hypothetical protein [Candidatus Pacearchaeota archaeon]